MALVGLTIGARRRAYRQSLVRGDDRAAALRRAWPNPRRLPRRVGRRAHAAWLAAHPVPAAPPSPVRVSVLTPVWRPDPQQLQAAIASVLSQSHPHRQLVLALDGPAPPAVEAVIAAVAADPSVRIVRLERQGGVAAATNAALAAADGESVLFLDHDDRLHPEALAHVAAAFSDPAVRAVYSDEDIIDHRGRRADPTFKGRFDYERLLAHNWVNHLFALRRDLLVRLGGLRPGLDGAQDHDLVLRVAEAVGPAGFAHLPHILYHWRQYPGGRSLSQSRPAAAQEARLRAVREHLQRRGLLAAVEPGPAGCRLVWPAADPAAVEVFRAPGAEPSAGWRQTMAALAVRPDVGAVLAGRGPGDAGEAGPRGILLVAHEAEPSGGLMVVERRKLEAVGGRAADEAPAALAWRLAQKGWRPVWTPDVSVLTGTGNG